MEKMRPSFEGGSVEQQEQKAQLTVDLFRHGEARYEQKKVSIAEADDLTEAGVRRVREQSEKLADSINPDEVVTIWTSPYGRTLQTAKILMDVLSARGVRFRKVQQGEEETYENVLQVFETFEEVRGFDQKVFAGLVSGGAVSVGEGELELDARQTNPGGLSWVDYYNSAAWQDIDSEYLRKLPEELVNKIMNIETDTSASARMMRKIKTLKSKLKPTAKTRIVIVSHQGLVSQYSDNEVRPADYVEMRL